MDLVKTFNLTGVTNLSTVQSEIYVIDKVMKSNTSENDANIIVMNRVHRVKCFCANLRINTNSMRNLSLHTIYTMFTHVTYLVH